MWRNVRHILKPVYGIRKPLTIFAKGSIFDVWLDSGYNSGSITPAFFWLHLLSKNHHNFVPVFSLTKMLGAAAVWARSVNITKIWLKSSMPCFFFSCCTFFCFSQIFLIFDYLLFAWKIKKVSTTIDLRDFWNLVIDGTTAFALNGHHCLIFDANGLIVW